MFTLEINKFFREIIDLQSFRHSENRKYILAAVQIFVVLPLFSVAFLGLFRFIFNINEDILQGLPLMIPIMGFPLIVIIYWYFLMHRTDFFKLFDDIQAIVDESKLN